MSLKNRDNHNRWRNKTVAFRVSPEEDTQIETFVKLSGLTKQDYITRRLTGKDVVVQGNPRVYKALRDQLVAVLDELRRIEAGGSVNDELLDVCGETGYLRNAGYGGTPEDRDATAILLTLPMGLVALFTEIPERGKRTKRDYRA